MKKLSLITVALVILVISCKKEKIEEPAPIVNDEKPGQFGISKMDGLNKTGGTAATGDTIEFDLGELKAGRAFYFLLSNLGDREIYDVTITSSRSQCLVTPATLNSIAPQANASVLPIMQLDLNHGIPVNGVGYIDLMPMGANDVIVEVTGKTTDSQSNIIDLKMVCKYSLDVKVLDIQMTYGENNSSLDFTDHSGGMALGEGGYVHNIVGAKTITVLNSGNVPVKLNATFVGNYPRNTIVYNIAPNGILTVDSTISNSLHTVYFAAEGENTISNHNKFKLIDGNPHFTLTWQ